MTTVVVDTPAMVAAMTEETGHWEIKRYLAEADERLMSAATLVELGLVIESRYRDAGAVQLENFLREAEIEIVDLTERHARHAQEGWRRFGKGRGHAAQLNLGDCCTYGLAVATGSPVVCTGEDFASTDLDVLRPAKGSAAS